MREIKFRAWDGKSMVDRAIGADIRPASDEFGIHFPASYSAYFSTSNMLVLMQFTGLLDRNCKEIYEGDILFDGDDSYDQVVYQENKFILEPLGDDCVYWEKTEVVGNIYEHSHLLK